ncbi:MAG: Xaa-Pro aminopeptidase [Bacteriovoracaceae bacterium]
MQLESDFKGRRQALGEMLAGGIAVLEAHTHQTRSFDTTYPFRQESNFKYLTGLDEPEAYLIVKDHPAKSILFVRPKDDFAEMWGGIRMGVDHVKKVFDFDEVHAVQDFDKILNEELKGSNRVYVDFTNTKLLHKMAQKVEELTHYRKQKVIRPKGLDDLKPLVGKLRLFKSSSEIESIRRAAAITDKAHRAAMAMARPGVNEAEIESLMEFIYRQNGAKHPAYESIIAGGANALVLHYIENNQPLKKGELLLIDAGSEFNCYASDVTRTFPVDMKFDPLHRELYEIVLEAQRSALSRSSSGHTLHDVHQAACKILIQGLLDHNILEGSVDENLEKGTFKDYYPHGTSHWLGLDVHDNSPYLDDELNELKLAPGMVFTIEPGLYFQHKNKCPDRYKGIGIRIEDDVLVTEQSYDNLTVMIPKSVHEIEEMKKCDYRDFLL